MDRLRRELPIATRMLDDGRLEEAGRLLSSLQEAHPFDSYVLYNTGLWHWRCRRTHEAIAHYRRALGANPNLVPAMTNLGSCLIEIGDVREAVRYLQMALRRRPNDPGCLGNLSIALLFLGEPKDALAAAEDGLRADPAHIICLRQRMSALVELGRNDDALAAGLAVLDSPRGRDCILSLVTTINLASKRSDWALIDALLPRLDERLTRPVTEVPPMSLTQTSDDPELLGRIAAQNHRGSTMPARPVRTGDGSRLTVAYMSPDLREHPVAHMLLDVLPHHDRQAFRILTVGTLPVDQGHWGQELARHCDGHIDLTRLDDSAAVGELRSRGVDVLVDLAGSTKWSRPGVLARRPCPAQVLWLGCPSSTGTPYYDAFLVDGVVAPPGYERWCTEPLYRLPCCYHPIASGLGGANPDLTRADVGLPEDATIVAVLQQPAKIRPPFIDHVVRCIARHPQAHLAIRIHDQGAEAALARFAALGLPAERVHRVPMYKERSTYLALYRLVDVLIDTHPYGGHSTTGEALSQGTPVLSVLGRSIHARVAASMLHELDQTTCILPDFPALTTELDRLLTDHRHLSNLAERFRSTAQTHRKLGPQRLTRALEQAFRNIYLQAPAAS